MKTSHKHFLNISRKHLPKETHRKLYLVKDEKDFEDIAIYALSDFLSKAHRHLDEKIMHLHARGKDVLILHTKLLRVEGKIHLFKVSGSEEEFYKVFFILKEVVGALKKIDHV